MRSGRNSNAPFDPCSLPSLWSWARPLAQDYPTRPITVIVPFPAGGPTDTIARVTAQSMSKLLGQQIIVENVSGAGGTLGTGRASRAAPDGYTLLLHHLGLATADTLYRKLPYDDEEGVRADRPRHRRADGVRRRIRSRAQHVRRTRRLRQEAAARR